MTRKRFESHSSKLLCPFVLTPRRNRSRCLGFASEPMLTPSTPRLVQTQHATKADEAKQTNSVLLPENGIASKALACNQHAASFAPTDTSSVVTIFTPASTPSPFLEAQVGSTPLDDHDDTAMTLPPSVNTSPPLEVDACDPSKNSSKPFHESILDEVLSTMCDHHHQRYLRLRVPVFGNSSMTMSVDKGPWFLKWWLDDGMAERSGVGSSSGGAMSCTCGPHLL